jgi:hypothetical protein
MSFEARCPQCLFVTRQLGQPTPCLLHLSVPGDDAEEAGPRQPDRPAAQDSYDEPYAFGQLRPTIDHPGPFSLREYVRLRLLRSRIQADPRPLDQLTPSAPAPQARSLSRR